MATRTFTLDELCTLVDLPRRTVRYYVQIGLVERPDGETRAARYGERHLAQLLRVKQLSADGVSLERIRTVMAGGESPLPPRQRQPGDLDVRSHLQVAPGIELVVSPEEAGLSMEQVRLLVREIMQAANKALGKA